MLEVREPGGGLEVGGGVPSPPTPLTAQGAPVHGIMKSALQCRASDNIRMVRAFIEESA